MHSCYDKRGFLEKTVGNTNAAFMANLAFCEKRAYQGYRRGAMVPGSTILFMRKSLRDTKSCQLRIFLQNPKEEVRLAPGETYTVKPKRAHLVTNAGESSATFLVLQGIGEYDFVPLV